MQLATFPKIKFPANSAGRVAGKIRASTDKIINCSLRAIKSSWSGWDDGGEGEKR